MDPPAPSHQPGPRTVAERWRAFHRRPVVVRIPVKLAVLLVVTAAVMYPKPWLLPAEVRRLRNLNAVIDPADPGLEPLARRVRGQLPKDAGIDAVRAAVEQVVYEAIPYSWDWDTWGVVEYLPTVAEALRAGREDCDGRAVVAASLLRRLGYDAWLVSDILHMWVRTPEGDLMSPTSTRVTVEAPPPGAAGRTRWHLNLDVVTNLVRGTAFGISVFPLTRELILLVTICLLSLHPAVPLRRRIAGCVMLAAALVLLRATGQHWAMRGGTLPAAGAMLGVLLVAAGWLVMAVRAAGRRPGCAPVPAESPAAGGGGRC